MVRVRAEDEVHGGGLAEADEVPPVQPLRGQEEPGQRPRRRISGRRLPRTPGNSREQRAPTRPADHRQRTEPPRGGVRAAAARVRRRRKVRPAEVELRLGPRAAAAQAGLQLVEEGLRVQATADPGGPAQARRRGDQPGQVREEMVGKAEQ